MIHYDNSDNNKSNDMEDDEPIYNEEKALVLISKTSIQSKKIRQELGQFSREKEINRPPKKNTFAICPIVCATAFVATTSCLVISTFWKKTSSSGPPTPAIKFVKTTTPPATTPMAGLAIFNENSLGTHKAK